MSGQRPLTAHRVAVIVLVASLAGCGDDTGDGSGITVGDAWARPTPGGADVAAVYFEARAGDGDVLMGIDVPPDVAGDASMHETTTDDGQTSMGPVDEVPLPDGEAVVFEPGGLHMMLNDLTGPLQDGDSFDVTLHFETYGPVTVTVDVSDR